MEQIQDNIRVIVRTRPPSSSECANDIVVDVQSSTQLCVTNSDGKRSFQCSFDAVLDSIATQVDVYNTVRECTNSVLEGFNSTIFAYGQTGSGKTYTMYGPPSDTGSRTIHKDQQLIGLIPRAINDIFELAANKAVIQLSVYCSFVQIYNENLYDMLRDSSMESPLTIREDNKEIYVQGLSEYNVKGIADTLQLLRVAEENRAIRETNMNLFSSRSHSIFQVFVDQKRVAEDGGELLLRSKFNLVDLAGSEKWNTRINMRDEHIAEMTNINLSLHTLGRCISALAQKSTKEGASSHVPYRESKLTRLLQDSLGSNAKTFLIATISPARINAEESISTLKFADRARHVMVQAVVNETRPVDHAMVQRLQREVDQLKQLIRQMAEHSPTALSLLGGTGPASGGCDVAVTPGSQSQGLLGLSAELRSVLQQALLHGGSAVPGSGVSGNIIASDAMTLSGNDATAAVMQALVQERQAVARLTSTNEALRHQLASLQRLNYGQEGEENKSNKNSNNSNNSSSNNLKQQMAVSPVEKDGLFLNREQTQTCHDALSALINKHQQQCNQVDTLQVIMRKFFKFQIEEDVMRAQVDQVFASLQEVNRHRPVSAAARSIALLDMSQSQSQAQAQSVDNATLQSSSSLPCIMTPAQQQQQQQQQQPRHRNTGKVPVAPQPAVIKSSRPSRNRLQDRQLSMSEDQTTLDEEQLMRPPLQSFSNQQAYLQNLANQQREYDSNATSDQLYHHQHQHQQDCSRAARPSSSSSSSKSLTAAHDSSSAASPVQSAPKSLSAPGSSSHMNNTSSMSSNSISNSYTYTAAATSSSSSSHNHNYPHQSQLAGSSLESSGRASGAGAGGGAQNLALAAGVEAALHTPLSLTLTGVPNVAYRVRGAGAPGNSLDSEVAGSVGSWVVDANATEEDEETRLQRELKKAKKKLKKQQQLQEWIRSKEDRAVASLKQEEEDRKILAEAEQERELKRKEYAKKIKLKIQGYQQQIKTEAEQIKELMDLGIDPSSLYG